MAEAGLSAAVSARYQVECPVCGAAPLAPCRTLRTGRVTDTHLPRIDAAFPGPARVVAHSGPAPLGPMPAARVDRDPSVEDWELIVRGLR